MQIKSAKPVVSVCAVRTGSGKSQTTRRVSLILRNMGFKVAAIRHPMPYGDLTKQIVQRFADYADTHYISALHGTGVGHLYKSVNAAYESATRKLNTNMLTRILEGAVYDHSPPMINGRRIKMRYAHAGGQNPPLIVIHGNQTGNVPNSYQRYLEKVYRRELKLTGTPIRIEFRTSENPYSEKRNKLTDRQVQRKRRLMAHVKKSKKKKK